MIFSKQLELKNRMSQDCILSFLKRYEGERFSIKEMQKYLNIEKSIYPNIKKLVDEGLIEFTEVIGKDKRNTYSVYFFKKDNIKEKR